MEMIHYTQDSLLEVPYRRRNGNSLNHRSKIFYDSLRIKAENKRFTRELYNALFTDTTKKEQTRKVLEPEIFQSYENKIIRSITIKHLDVFGPSIEDTTIEATSFLKRIGNDLHIETRERIIKNSLMFNEGEKLNPFFLFENERLLRELPYINDARFLIGNGSARDDSVDVVLLIKDLWPFGFGAELSDLQQGNVSLWHTNFLGLGHQLEAKLFWHTAKDKLLGNSIIYRIANLNGSYITGSLYYVDRWNLETYRLDLFRNFMASDINWAGAVSLEKTKTTQSVALRDTTLEEVQLEYLDHDFWLGYLFSPGTRNGNQHTKTNFFIAGRIWHNDFSVSPETRENYLYQFQDKTRLLFSLGFSKQGFYRSNLIYSFGQTEDVPFGYLVKVTGGFEQGQYKYRPYAGISASAGFNIDHLGYLYSLCELGSFFHDKSTQQGVFRIMIKYFTDLQSVNRFKFRQFITAEYTRGINRDADEFVSLENRHGITGLGSRYLRGNEKKLLKLESVVFTPYQLFGFRFVGFAFADLGIIRGSSFDESNNKLFSGIGIGLRIRNERLVFNTLQLKLTWYVSQPEESVYQYFIASGEPRFVLKNFYMEKPEIINLR
ncbi:MAG: hypothetical protein JXK95_16365 [Bacteroidales bacterium]|nr:hypothetical protein [Bacteroidales bacterium]